MAEVRRLGNLADHARHGHVEHAAERDRPAEHGVRAEEPPRRVLREHHAVRLAQRVLRVARDERQVEDVEKLGVGRDANMRSLPSSALTSASLLIVCVRATASNSGNSALR